MRKLLFLLCAVCSLVFASAIEAKTVKGTVLDASTGEPLIGATIMADGTNNGVATDLEGRFSFNVPDNVKNILVSYVGYESKVVPAAANVKVELEKANTQLEDVVVVAYGTATKNSLTGAVSQVDSKQIEKRVSTTVTGALEGAAPGVQVNNTYGEPGTAPKIRIRGFGSLQANSPLIVLDGVAFDGNIAEINPNDIESMTVLKDAASAALYGNKAAAGVVLITTKSGKNNDKLNVSLSINAGMYQRGIPEYDRLGVKDWMETSWVAMKNYAMTGSMALSEADAKAYAGANLYNYVQNNIFDVEPTAWFDAEGNFQGNVLPGYNDLDWAKELERTGVRQEYNLSAQSAGEKYTMYSSIGYLKEEGYVRNTQYERMTGRINTTFTPNKWFKGGINLSGTHSTQNYNDNATGNYFANPFYNARYMAPVYPIYMHNADGSIVLDAEGNKVFDTTSPYLSNRNIIFEIDEDKLKSTRNVLGGQIFGTIMLPYGFDVTVRGDYNHATTNLSKYNNPEIGDGATNNGRFTSSAYQYTNYTLQEMINWSQNYGKHHVDVLLGHENYEWKRSYTSGMMTDMAMPGNLVLGNFLTYSYFYGYDDKYTTESYLGRARYNFNEKYFGEVSFRRDGSSKFHKDNRWGNFFSVGASWNMKKEEFLKNVDAVNHLKLRASYGEVGNDAGVNYYAYQALYTVDKNAGAAALVKASLAAPDIKWETSQTFDVAAEGRFFNRLNASIGYFDKRSKDLLMAVKLPYSVGSYPWDENSSNLTMYQNIGSISNYGVEIQVDGDIIANRDWTWNLGIDATIMKNKIVTLPGGKDIPSGMQRYSEGHSIYEFYTYHFEGVDQMTGRSLYTLDPEQREKAVAAGQLATINGKEYTMDTSFGLKDWAGSALPDVYGSINTSLRWKDLSLSALFTYSLGGKTYDGAYHSLMSTGSATSAAANHVDLLDSWNGVPEGMTEDSPNRIDPNGLPAVDFNNSTYNNSTSDRWLVSSSYLVFKNINLSWNLPKNWMRACGLSGATLKVGAENLFTLTARKGLNPQYSFSGGSDDTYVTARVFNFGVNVNF